MRTAVVASGALAAHVTALAERRGWSVDVHPLPPELHNRPERIAPAVADLLDRVVSRELDPSSAAASILERRVVER